MTKSKSTLPSPQANKIQWLKLQQWQQQDFIYEKQFHTNTLEIVKAETKTQRKIKQKLSKNKDSKAAWWSTQELTWLRKWRCNKHTKSMSGTTSWDYQTHTSRKGKIFVLSQIWEHTGKQIFHHNVAPDSKLPNG